MISDLESFIDLSTLFHDLECKIRDVDYSAAINDFQSNIAANAHAASTDEHDRTTDTRQLLQTKSVARRGRSNCLFESAEQGESLVRFSESTKPHTRLTPSMLFGVADNYGISRHGDVITFPTHSPHGMSDETLDDLCDRIAESAAELFVKG